MMKLLMSTVFAVTITGGALAAPLDLSPANPQPSGVKSGLAVSYAYGAGGRTLSEAHAKLKSAKAGPPIVGFSYLDSNPGDKALTSDKAEKVAASISGFIRFDKAGTFQLEFLSNDGLEASIGGAQVVNFDGVHGCDSAGVTEVNVPSAGWYALEATYFQRKGSHCLLMDWNVDGEMEPVPDAVFGH